MKSKLLSMALAVSCFCSNIASMPCYGAEKTENTSSLSDETLDFYDYWKEKYLVQNPYATDNTQYYVFYGDQTYEQAGYEVPVTVSEAHGYGMLISASMAEYDTEAKDIFDGMYHYYRAHLSEIGPNLMAWQQSDNGKALVNSSGADSATDGDLDIAYSLLMADSIWGSDGEINYKKTAIDMINDIMEYEVNQNDWVLRLGDWAYWSEEGDKYYSATRASDFIVQYMPVFAEATGDERWLELYDTTYEIINRIVDEYGTGILPDFIIKDDNGKFIPAPANFLESENDGNYYYNSCRTPWRISMDYLINGNQDAKRFADAITAFIIEDTKGDPWEIMAGYTPQGEAVSDWNDLCFNSPFIIAAACGDNIDWHDNVRDMCLNYGEDLYFGDTITMLCLIVDDGGWIVPKNEITKIVGDVNADGKFTVADVVTLQKWLLAVPDVILADWKAANLCVDDRLDVFDLCLMKRELLAHSTKNTPEKMPVIMDVYGEVTDTDREILWSMLSTQYPDMDFSEFKFVYDPNHPLGNYRSGKVFSIYYKDILLHGYGNLDTYCNAYAGIGSPGDAVNFVVDPKLFAQVDTQQEVVPPWEVLPTCIDTEKPQLILYVDDWDEKSPRLAYRAVGTSGEEEWIFDAVTGEEIAYIPYYVV